MPSLRSVYAVVLFGIVVLAPVPFASGRDWAWAPLAGLVGFALLIQSAAELKTGCVETMSLRGLLLPCGIVVAVSLWAMVQTLPLWGLGVSLFSSAQKHYDLGVAHISPNVERSLTGLMRFLTYCGTFWLSSNLCRNVRYARHITSLLVASATFVTLYGFAMHADNKSCVVLTIVKLPIGSSCAFSGTFINADSYASFVALAALASISEVYALLLRLDPKSTWRQRLRERVTVFSGVGGVWIGTLVVLTGGLILSGSRAGTLSFISAGLAMVLLLNVAQGRKAAVAISVVAMFAILMISLSGEMLISRLIALSKVADSDRIALYRLSLSAIALHPWVGWGLGSFEGIYSLLQPPQIELSYDMAHNVYLESAIELGLPAAFGLMLAIMLPAVTCLKGIFRRRRNAHYPALGLAAALLIAIHSLFDFSVQIPAVATTFASILGLGWAQSRSSRT